jgi:hypothetical protein
MHLTHMTFEEAKHLPSSEMMLEVVKLTEEQHRRARSTRLFRYRPYTRQREFHDAGAEHRERVRRIKSRRCLRRGATWGEAVFS